MITKYGYRIISYTAILLLIVLTLSVIFNLVILWIITAAIGCIFIFHFFFFRDPAREVPQGASLIISPADGQIIKIDEVQEPLFFKEKVRRVSIFMTIFNVHINRMPVSGKVELIKYGKGEFLSAFRDAASVRNEQNAIGLTSDKGKLLFTQIAGLIARRIVCTAKPGDKVQAGERFGMIKYSSRVDIYLPLNVKINVKYKQWVKGGLTVIGEFESC